MARQPQQQLTARGIAALKPGEWANDSRPRGGGQLQVRKLTSGAAVFYYRYTGPAGKQDRLPLGTGLTLAQARERASALSQRYQAGERDLRGALAAEGAARERAAAQAGQEATLGALLGAYVAWMRAAGKVSADSVENTLVLHVEEAWPTLWTARANALQFDDLLPAVARLVAAKKLREAGKLRSYLRAAYAAAIRARQDAAMPDNLREMGIAANPARDLATVEGGSNARTRVLSLGELRAYWRRIAAMADAEGAMLRFHLLTGGQRIAQLGRLLIDALDRDSQTIRILDIKGRRKKAREHFVPLLDTALNDVATMRGGGLGPYLFTINEGVEPVSYDDLAGAMAPVVAAMAEAEELENGRFTPGDLRRTVETRLAAIGQSSDIRGHLQSHGLGGVQNRHYNRHDYDGEKRSALEALHNLLVREPATVTAISGRGGTQTAA